MGETGLEVYALAHGRDEWILYAPRHRKLLLVDGPFGQALSDGTLHEAPERRDALAAELAGEPLRMSRQEEAWDPTAFKPAALALALSMDCNLECVYCHAAAGASGTRADLRMLLDAIDFFLESASAAGHPSVSFSLAGGGEPTLEWDLLVACVEAFETRARARGLRWDIGMATNGSMSEEQCAFVIAHFRGISLSIDGAAAIHNAQRPGRGFDSFERALRTGRQLGQAGLPFGVHVTVTRDSMPLMTATVDLVADELPGARGIGFEPMVTVGRGAGYGVRDMAPDLGAFADEWLRALGRGKERGVRTFYSGAGQLDEVRPLFCSSVLGPDLTVTWDGRVSACNRDNPDSFFQIGAWDAGARTFRIDGAAVARVKRDAIARREACASCFCVYNCGGDCSDLRLRTSVSRCPTNRRIAYVQLCQKLGVPAGPRVPAFRRLVV